MDNHITIKWHDGEITKECRDIHEVLELFRVAMIAMTYAQAESKELELIDTEE